jgi:hypothetical protein
LDDKGQSSNENEDPVSENSGENVEFTFFEKSGIELIEKLHEDKDLEYVGEVEKLHGSCVLWNVSWHDNILGPVGRFLELCTGLFIFKMVLLINEAAEIS